MKSAVSVLIPTYNRVDLLGDTLKSVLSQTYEPAEVIVVDDGSTDATRSLMSKFESRVRYHVIENGGVCRARNVAESLARHPYIAFCDSDDLWRPDKLARQMSLHERNPLIRYSFTDFSIVSNGVWSKKTKFESAPPQFFPRSESQGEDSFVISESFYLQILSFQPIFPSTVVMTRELFHEVGGYRENLGRNPSEDFEFTLRCVRRAPIGVVSKPVVGIRKHESNFSGDNTASTRGEIEILQYALEQHGLDETITKVIREQIAIRRLDLLYNAFRKGEFGEVKSLVSLIPKDRLTVKDQMKLRISQLPRPIAKAAQRVFVSL